jgi:hypothetical protein
VGIIVRDHQGNVRAINCMARRFLNDPSIAEGGLGGRFHGGCQSFKR